MTTPTSAVDVPVRMWQAHVMVESKEPLPMNPEETSDLLGELMDSPAMQDQERGAAASCDPYCYSVTFCAFGTDPLTAATDALTTFTAAVAQVELPVLPVVRLELVDWDAVERDRLGLEAMNVDFYNSKGAK